MAIKDHLESTKQDDWIEYIINALNGTSDELEYMMEEYLDMGFDEDALTTKIDSQIWCCEQCGWWVEVCDTNEDGICRDCEPDEDE